MTFIKPNQLEILKQIIEAFRNIQIVSLKEAKIHEIKNIDDHQTLYDKSNIYEKMADKLEELLEKPKEEYIL